MKKIFISSTCYDLIDVRAELEEFLLSNGLLPILSDSMNSEFEVQTDKNSIETCLVNVRNSDIVLIILSQRYGGSLASVGFADKSATHLEYEEALKHNKPIYMYVRDKLEAENAIYTKTKDPKILRWVKERDIKIFDILDQHKKLTNGNINNWYWTFKNSVELKNRISKDLAQLITKELVQSKLKTNAIPSLVVQRFDMKLNSNGDYQLSIKILNAGNAVAINPISSMISYKDESKTNYVHDSTNMRLPSLKPYEEYTSTMLLKLKEGFPEIDILRYSISYITVEGYKIADINHLRYDHYTKEKGIRGSTPTYKGKVFYHDESIEIHKPDKLK